MNRLILAALSALALTGCAKEAESTATAGRGVEVDRLFVHEGCAVYRFHDAGRYHYFTNCAGSTMSTYTVQCGKARCSYNDDIPGATPPKNEG